MVAMTDRTTSMRTQF